MKPGKILLTLLFALTFSNTIHAEKYKFKVCEEAEYSFWKILDSVNSNTDRSLYESLDKKDKINYLTIVSAKVEQSMSDVKNRCRTMSPNILDTYNKKIRALQKQLNALQ